MPRARPRASTTNTMGARRSFASAALQSEPSTSTPSCRPLAPSINGDVRPTRVAGEGRENLGRRLGVEVEIVAGAPARPFQPHRVDIVRPLLEGLDAEASLAERRCEPDRRASSCRTICASPTGRDASWRSGRRRKAAPVARAPQRLRARTSASATFAASPSALNAIASVPMDGRLAIFVGDLAAPQRAEPGEVHRLVRRPGAARRSSAASALRRGGRRSPSSRRTAYGAAARSRRPRRGRPRGAADPRRTPAPRWIAM